MISRDFLTIRGRVSLKAAILFGAIPILVIFAVWWYLTAGEPEERVISSLSMPSPMEVFSTKETVGPLLKGEGSEPALFAHTLVSLRRVGLGYLLALGVTFPLGLFMGSFGSIRAVFSPVATASGYIPIATLVPLTMSWFGTDELQKVVFLSMAFAIYLLPMIIRAVDGVPDVYLRTASTLGASRWQIVFRVLLPVSLPDIWAGMRVAFGVGWTYLVLVEVVLHNGGLGHLIGVAQRLAKPGRVYLVILVITLIAWLSDLLWATAGKLLFPYKKVTGK